MAQRKPDKRIRVNLITFLQMDPIEIILNGIPHYVLAHFIEQIK